MSKSQQNHCTRLFAPAVPDRTYFLTALSAVGITLFSVLSNQQANHDLSFVLLYRIFITCKGDSLYLLFDKHLYFHKKDEI